jgi:hypothetical protein
MEGYSTKKEHGIVHPVTSVPLVCHSTNLLIEEGHKTDHCNRCMTDRKPEFVYPLSERDISMFVYGDDSW